MELIAKITDDYGTEENFSVPSDESGFYQTIAQKVTKLPFPNKIRVSIMNKEIVYEAQERGGTCNIQEKSNNIIFKVSSKYPKKYLTYADTISAEKKAAMEKGITIMGNSYGSYKFYSLEQTSDGKIKAEWGRISMGIPNSCTYPVSMFWFKYYEKLQKGYVDNTEAYVDEAELVETPKKKEEPKASKKPEIKVNRLSQRLFKLLQTKALNFISEHFESRKNRRGFKITAGMVNKSKEYLAQLYETEDLEEFNRILLQLCMVCPRKVLDMNSLTAKTKDDIPDVLRREESLVDAMEGVLLNAGKDEPKKEDTKKQDEDPDPFMNLGISISEVTPADRSKIDKMLPNELRSKIRNIYKVEKKEHDKRFKDYLKANKITQTKLLWHGSRNENWLSIINAGLLLKPNARITGKMFGNGIYFAPSAMKSWGYTSYHGSYWAGGSSDLAFMGIYEVAYGDPYFPSSGESWNYTESFLKKKNKNCVHAQGGKCGLRNDEIIFYNESAMCLRYVVEFG